MIVTIQIRVIFAPSHHENAGLGNAESMKTPEINMSAMAIIATSVPPATLEAAAERIFRFSDPDMTGLVGVVFRDVDQFVNAMTACGWFCSPTEVLRSQVAVSFKILASHRDGRLWTVLATEIGRDDDDHFLRIENAGKN